MKYLKPFKINETIEIGESDLDQIASIVDDFNMTAKDEYYSLDATLLQNTYWQMQGGNKIRKQGFVVMISDQTETYDGFDFSQSTDLLLRLIDLLGLGSIQLRINLIGEPGSKFRTYSQQDIIEGIQMAPISRLWVQFYIDNNSKLNESNKFLALKEDLHQIKDICKSEEFLDYFNLVIGHCGVNQNYSGMDTYMNDIFIKMATIGHQAIVVALDFHESEMGKLPQQDFNIVKSTFERIIEYLQVAEYNILHVWFKKIVWPPAPIEHLYEPRLSRIHWFDYDLSDCMTKFETINFTGSSYITEIRIVFTGGNIVD